jgi:hypothetical protein
MSKNTLSIILLGLGALLQITPATLHAFNLEGGELLPVSLPAIAEPAASLREEDLDGNGSLEYLAVSHGILKIISGNMAAWQSPPEWNIVQAAITDLNLDGHPEVALLLWRPFLPWPVDQWLPNGGRIDDFHNAKGQSCHFILIGWKNNGYHELWAGSAMADPIISFAAVDLDGDSYQELVALEGRYSASRSSFAHTLKIWKWNGFGFSVVSSMDGIFNKITLVQVKNSKVLILVP